MFSFCGKNDDGGPPPIPPKTDTLGSGWQKITMPDTLGFDDVFFVNDATGYICGFKYLAKSIDGGLSWSKYTIPDSLSGGFINIFFLDVNHGWVVSDAHIIKTDDGGKNWQYLKLNTPYGGGPIDIQFLSPLIGYMTSGSGFYKTADGGVTWTKINSAFPTRGLYFFNNNTGWVSSDGIVKHTNNGGSSFDFEKIITSNRDQNYIVQFTDMQHGWVTGDKGIIWSTTNGGVDWEQLLSDGTGGDVHFFDNNNGFLVSGATIYRTMDGGKTLIKEASIRKSNIVEIHFTDANHGWAAGSSGGLYKYLK